jgi:hypothetical protein
LAHFGVENANTAPGQTVVCCDDGFVHDVWLLGLMLAPRGVIGA